MKRPLWQDALFAFSVLLFACLLLSGGSRLIAVPEEHEPPIMTPSAWLEASLSCPPSASHEGMQTRQQEGRKAAAEALVIGDSTFAVLSIPVTDANGNILRHRSYMHAVYQAFALGDGFA